MWNGADGAINYDLGIEAGTSVLESGKVYAVSKDLAKRLVASNEFFSEAKETKDK